MLILEKCTKLKKNEVYHENLIFLLKLRIIVGSRTEIDGKYYYEINP